MKIAKNKKKKLHEVKTQILEENLEILKFSNPPVPRIYRSNFFLIDFDIWNIEIGVLM